MIPVQGRLRQEDHYFKDSVEREKKTTGGTKRTVGDEKKKSME